MIQEIIVGLAFAAALIYAGNVLLRSFRAKDGCATGCGKCEGDIQKLEASIKEGKH